MSMALIEARGNPFIECPKCKTLIVWPASLEQADKAWLAGEVRSDMFEGVKLAHSRLEMEIREAKALSFHITRRKGECHRCQAPLEKDISVCDKCRSANLDW